MQPEYSTSHIPERDGFLQSPQNEFWTVDAVIMTLPPRDWRGDNREGLLWGRYATGVNRWNFAIGNRMLVRDYKRNGLIVGRCG